MFNKQIMLFGVCGVVYQSIFFGSSTVVMAKRPLSAMAKRPPEAIAQQQMQNPIMIQLIAEPLEFSLPERANFKIGIEAKNVGNQTVDPKLDETELVVNGETSFAWYLAIGNGIRDESWWNLKPGETISTYRHLGKVLFPQPGEYNVLLRYGSQESSVRIRVTS